MNNMALDIYDEYPKAMKLFLSHYGWNFNKKAFEYAVSKMMRRNPSTNSLEKVTPFTKEKVMEILSQHGITLNNDVLYNSAFVANMCKADYWGSSIEDDRHLALYVKDTVDDPDAAEGTIMRRWYATMVAAGKPVPWDDFME